MGEHYAMLNYETPQAMVEAFKADEENHLKGIIDFLIHENIDDDLRAHRWAVVARVYNGPGYAKHGYDIKLEKAYAKWRRIKDTPFNSGE